MSLRNIAIAFDQLVNAILAGDPDETLSARAYRNRFKKRRWAIAHAVINAIFFWQPAHCEGAWSSERARLHLSKEYRT